MIGRWIESLLGRFGYIKLTAYRRALLDKSAAAPPLAPAQHYAPMTLPAGERLGSTAPEYLPPEYPLRSASSLRPQPAPDPDGRTRVYVPGRYRW